MYTISVPLINWTDFCDQELQDLIKLTTRQNEANFVPTTVIGAKPEDDYRRSLVLWHTYYEVLKDRFTKRIEQVLPQVREDLGDYCYQYPHTNIEVQLTTHFRNGDHFKKHVDNGSAETYGRRLTFVYYYQLSEERNYSGGELLLYLKNGIRVINPIHNTIVFFPSYLYHEVIPVHCPTEKFEDGRFTLNGWTW